MFKIKLFCAGGASTGILAKKIEAVAKEKGMDAEVTANAIAEVNIKGKDADVILLGPQVGFQLDEVKAMFPTKAVMVVEMADYGRMNALGILKQAITLYKQNRKAQG